MSDTDLRDQAVDHLKATRVSYQRWLDNVRKGVYTPKDGSGTEWGKAFALLAQIGGSAPPPPPTTTNHLGLIRYGGDVESYASRLGEYGLVVVSYGDTVTANRRTLIYCDALTINATSPVDLAQFQSLGYSTGYQNGNYPGDFAKVGDANFRRWFAQQVVAFAKTKGAFGVFLDDCAMQARITTGGRTFGLSDSSSPSCQQVFGLTLAGFQAAMVAVATELGAQCAAAGLYLAANCNAYIAGVQDDAVSEANWIARLAGPLDAAMSESFMTLRDGSNTPRTSALGVVTAGWNIFVSKVEQLGVDFIGLTYGPVETALYGYASLLTQAKRPGSVFMWGADSDPALLLGRYTGTASVNLDAGAGVVA